VLVLVAHRPVDRCLITQSGPPINTSAAGLGELPGQRYTPDQQCQLIYGEQSYYCGVRTTLHHGDLTVTSPRHVCGEVCGKSCRVAELEIDFKSLCLLFCFIYLVRSYKFTQRLSQRDSTFIRNVSTCSYGIRCCTRVFLRMSCMCYQLW